MGTVVAAALPAGGCASARPAAVVATSTGRTVHLTAYSADDGPTSTVILTGAVGDFGHGTTGGAGRDQRGRLSLALSAGSFRIDVAALDRKIVEAFSHFPGDPDTCSGTVTVTNAAPIVADTGTGSYAGISGTFHLTATIDEVDTKPNCDASARFRAEAIVVTGSGLVTFE